MNFKKKWKDALVKRLRSEDEVELSTRSATELGYISELEDEGKIEVVRRGSGLIVCRLKPSSVSPH
jgi:hypothetical protein